MIILKNFIVLLFLICVLSSASAFHSEKDVYLPPAKEVEK